MANGTIIIEAKNKSSAMKSLKQAPKSALKALLWFSANPLPENSWQVAAPWVPPPMGPWTTNGSPSRYD